MDFLLQYIFIQSGGAPIVWMPSNDSIVFSVESSQPVSIGVDPTIGYPTAKTDGLFFMNLVAARNDTTFRVLSGQAIYIYPKSGAAPWNVVLGYQIQVSPTGSQ